MSDDRTAIMSARALAPGYSILWYTIKEVLGQGGFGITYLAHDNNLDKAVAIKEYLPTPFAYRHQDYSVKPLTGDHHENFRWGLQSFLTEAQTLAKFGHDNIVRVHSVFEENSTAYMVMEYEQGASLSSLYDRRSEQFDQNFYERTLFPIFDGLEQIHRMGFIHRDIKPANIYIRQNGTPVLIDFGSARQTSKQHTGEMTSLVSKGYTPLEQYSANYGDQGPWTDIYALAATIYQGVVGQKPDESLSRSAFKLRNKPDSVIRLSASDYPQFDQRFLDAVFAGLALEPEGRPQDLSTWMQYFRSGSPILPGAPSGQHIPPPHERTVTAPGSNRQGDHGRNPITDFGTDLRDDPRAGLRPETPTSARPITQSVDHGGTRSASTGLFDLDDDFGDDMDRPADATQRGVPLSRKPEKRSSPVLKVVASLGVVAVLAGAGFAYMKYFAADSARPITIQALAALPQPSSSIPITIASEHTQAVLQDLITLGQAYRKAHAIDPANVAVQAGIQSSMATLDDIAGQWNFERHTEIAGLVNRVAAEFPIDDAQRGLLNARLQPGGQFSPLSQVQALLRDQQIADPSGNSVFDQANKLNTSDFAQIRASSEWTKMMSELRSSVLEKIELADFDGAARLVEAGLSLDPSDSELLLARRHLAN